MFKETWKNYSWIEKAMILSPVGLFSLYFLWKFVNATFVYVNVPCNEVVSQGWIFGDRPLHDAGFENFSFVEIKDLSEDVSQISDVKIGHKLYTEADIDKNIWGFYFKNTPVVITYHTKSEKFCSIFQCLELPLEGHRYCKQHTCMMPDCFEGRDEGLYCYNHVCHAYGCKNSTATGEDYCSKHRCQEPGCSKKIAEDGQRFCSQHNVNTNKSSSTPRKSSSSKKKYVEWPDPDDYDSYEDFMDDWDGDMPYGIDAEDYWEDW